MPPAVAEALAARARELTEGWPPAAVAALEARLWTEWTRRSSLKTLDGPLDLLLALNPTWTATPALRLISEEMEQAITTPGSRLMVSLPPQEGKSRLARHAVVRALQHNPDCRIAIASYQERLARKSGEAARNIVSTRGARATDPVTGAAVPDMLGVAVKRGSAAAGDWAVDGRDGGVLSVGVGSGITGNAVDLLVVDDPLKGRQQADSEVIREALHAWWDNDAETRLGPQSSVVIIQTRWHEDDLIGRLLRDSEADDAVEFGAERDDQWRVVNIPALADGETLDSLDGVPGGRSPDGWLISARGDRTPKWARLMRSRPRVWASLYQGRPAPLEGGIFQRSWFENHRWRGPAPAMDLVAVGVDPADTGTGDAAGILVAGRTPDGRIPFLADLSGQLSQHQWARRACLAWARWDARRIVQERNLGMRTSIPDAWALIYRQARALDEVGRDTEAAVKLLVERGDAAAASDRDVREVVALVDYVLARGTNGPRVVSQVAKVSKRNRAEDVAGAFESGRAFVVGELPQLEHEAATWQEGQKSPNRLDTMAMLAGHLEVSQQKSSVSTRPKRRPPGGPLGRGAPPWTPR